MGDGRSGNPVESVLIAFGSIVCNNPLGCRLGNAVEVGNQPRQHYIQCGGPAEPNFWHEPNSCHEYNSCYEPNAGGRDPNSGSDSDSGRDSNTGGESLRGGGESADDGAARSKPSHNGIPQYGYEFQFGGQCLLGCAAGSGSTTPGNE